MEDLSLGRYLRMAGLTLGLALIIYLIELLFFAVLGLDFPQFLRIMLALLGAGLIVYKFFAGRIF